jgi:tRNA(Ile)-lysidine synthase
LPAGNGPIERSVIELVREYGLLSGGETVLVAVSGGPDSVCLLHVLNRLQKDLDILLHVAHLDHGLRGAEAEADARYVEELAGKLGIPATIEKRDVNEFNKERRTSIEEAAREVRYRFLDEVAEKVGASRVAVGHTRDDQVETLLMHYLRGTGIQGLRGLRPAAPIPYGKHDDGRWVIRPLLDTARMETGAYCQSAELQPRIDSSNEQTGFVRNRIRIELIPLLKQYNPDIEDTLIRLADLAGEDADFIDRQAAVVFDQTTTSEGCLTCLDAGKLRGVPLSLQRRVFRLVLERAYGSLKDIESAHVESLVKLLFGTTGKCISLPGGLTATNERNRMVIVPQGSQACPWPALDREYKLKIPGETVLPGWKVTSEIIGENYFREDDIFSVSLDLNKSGRALSVRGRKPGDRFNPLGMTHSRKLQDFMVDSAVPRSWRDSVPLVCSPQQVVWVVGWRMDDRVKVTTSTEQVLRLEFQRDG